MNLTWKKCPTNPEMARILLLVEMNLINLIRNSKILKKSEKNSNFYLKIGIKNGEFDSRIARTDSFESVQLAPTGWWAIACSCAWARGAESARLASSCALE